MLSFLADSRQRLSHLAGTLDAYSPAKKLSQGYAYVSSGDKAVKTVKSLSKDDTLDIYFVDGQVKTIVSEVIVNERGENS